MGKTVVLGAGVVGVAAAYYLSRAGHDVLVIERQPQAGLETSFANAGLLTPGHALPWAAPDVPRKMLKWLGREDAPLRFRLHADPAQWRWLLQFLRNCTRSRFEAHAGSLIELALYNRALLAELQSASGIEFDGNNAGLLHIFDKASEYEAALAQAEFMTRHGVTQHQVDGPECLLIEPALAHCSYPIAGGIHTPGDACGDALKFSQGLAEHCQGLGVEFQYERSVQRLEAAGAEWIVHTADGGIPAERVILCLGSFSPALLRPLGIRLPVQPVKGYSVTATVTDERNVPTVSLYDEKHKIGVSRLGNRIRAGGTAEFAGFDSSVNPVRGEALLRALRELAPHGLDFEGAEHWAGLRPMSADGMPIIGDSPRHGLYLNTGHGTLGWTLACASGKSIADSISGKTPQVGLDAFALSRF